MAFNIGDRVEVLSNAPPQFAQRQGEVVEIDGYDEVLGCCFLPIGIRFRAEGETFWFEENELKLVDTKEEAT